MPTPATKGARISPARKAAFDVLYRVEVDQAYAINLVSSSSNDALSRQDHSLLQELTLGVLRWRGQLDYLAAHYSRRAADRLDTAVRIALHIGLYQIRFLTRVPAHAAVNESVEMIKEHGSRGAASLVNAVLRAAERDRRTSLDRLLESVTDPLERLSVETSHPRWLLERWTARYGTEEARQLALSNNSPHRAWFRFNSNRAPEGETRAWFAANDYPVEDSSLVPGAASLAGRGISSRSDPVREGRIFFQDAASQLVSYMAAGTRDQRDPSAPPLRVADLCAPPGGKSFILESLLPDALFVAGDLHRQRLRVMRSLARQLNGRLPALIELDATAGLPFKAGAFDVVLVDAPCTGLGTLQRNPEIKWRLKPRKILELAARQRVLIEHAGTLVRSGGLLTYSVCSTEPEEGEDIVAEFKRAHPEYRDVTRERLVELGLDAEQFLTKSYGARTLTHRQQTESFFVAVLWRRS
jgi:16S rRNA (cytosine967-C5)-methyltransferase